MDSFPLRDVLGTCLIVHVGTDVKELFGSASENPVKNFIKIHIDKENPLSKLLPL